MGIIGILAGVGLPAIRGIGRANAITAANRQFQDDLAFARLRALNARTTVYLVFAPVVTAGNNLQPLLDKLTGGTPERRKAELLLGSQYTSYALIARRSVGDQPGRETPRYLTEWKTLPEGTLFETNKLIRKFDISLASPYLNGLPTVTLPYPSERGTPTEMRSFIFNSQGQLVGGRDDVMPIAQGSVFFTRDTAGKVRPDLMPDVVMTPAGNWTNNNIRINWVTGRANLERPVNAFP